MRELIDNVIQWADDKNLLKKENTYQQLAKVVEELGETSSALVKNQPERHRDNFGDLLVTIIILAKQNDLDIEDCLQVAWNEIKNRTGKTVNGTFIKD